jgi:hypothetical protein
LFGFLSSGFLFVNAPRRFPPPWTIEELDTCFVVRDHIGGTGLE